MAIATRQIARRASYERAATFLKDTQNHMSIPHLAPAWAKLLISGIPNLPALRSLGNLGCVRPVVVIGTREYIERGEDPSSVVPKTFLATLAAQEARFDMAVVFFTSPEEARRLIEGWAFSSARELVVNLKGLPRATKGRTAA